jgi:hypothetical protein
MKNNTPAFPVTEDNYVHKDNTGITIRDYFAAKAMHGLISAWVTGIPPIKETTQAAYAFADAMLKARTE